MVCSGVASLTIWSRYANFKALLLFISLELIVFTVIEYENIYLNSGTKVVYTFMLVKGTVSPPERCDLFHVKVGTFQVCRICGKGVLFYNQGRR